VIGRRLPACIGLSSEVITDATDAGLSQ